MTSAPTHLKIALAQANPTVGDIDGNIAKLREMRARAAALGADLVVFPELFVTGYPPEDLVLKPAFPATARARVEALAAELGPGPAVLTGTVWPEGGHVYNAVVLIDNGKVEAVRFKVDLPNYGVFDEKRVFTPGPMPGPINFRGVRLGVPICEDIWGPDVVECLAGDRRRDPHLAQRLALRLDEARRAHEHRRRARRRERPAAHLRQPGRRPGRARVRRRFVRAQRRQEPRRAATGLGGDARAHRVAQSRTAAGAARPGHARGDRARAMRRPIRPACWACATTSRRTAFPASSSGCRAASIARWWPRSPSMRWAHRACARS